MCTAVLSIDPSSPVPVLLVGVRDEFVDRDWRPPGRYWPDRPGVVAGRDLRAGGTWLAADPAVPRAGCVLNGHGRPAPEADRLSRGELPLRAAAEGKLGDVVLARFDPFHLIAAEPGLVRLWSWDGFDLLERELGPGLHLIVNSGLEGADWAGSETPEERAIVAQMSSRIEHFRPLLTSATRPTPLPGPATTAAAWGEWLPLVDGAGLAPEDPRALVLRRDLADRGIWGTTSISLVALSPQAPRYDFRPAPQGTWTTIL